MNLWQIIVLGILQGLTEFLPISSTAHLRIFPSLFGWEDPGAAVTAILQLGTLLALLFYFRRECLILLRTAFDLARGGKRNAPNNRLLFAILGGTLPIGVCGYIFREWIKTDARSLWIVAGALILVGLVLWIAEVIASLRRDETEIRISDGIWVGLAQVLALVPGVSRAGICISAGLFLGLRRDSAARFSFLLGIPALFAAGVFELWEIWPELTAEKGLLLLVGTLVSAISGYLTIGALLRFLQKKTNGIFIVYRILLGISLIFLLWQGVLSPYS